MKLTQNAGTILIYDSERIVDEKKGSTSNKLVSTR